VFLKNRKNKTEKQKHVFVFVFVFYLLFFSKKTEKQQEKHLTKNSDFFNEIDENHER
jgi:hypothetical protein